VKEQVNENLTSKVWERQTDRQEIAYNAQATGGAGSRLTQPALTLYRKAELPGNHRRLPVHFATIKTTKVTKTKSASKSLLAETLQARQEFW